MKTKKKKQPQFCQPSSYSNNLLNGFCSSVPCILPQVYYQFKFIRFQSNLKLSFGFRNLFSIFTFLSQVIKTQPGRNLVVHYQSITGEEFELHVHDGNTTNATLLTLVNQWTGANQAVTPSSSSGHELFIKFRSSARRNDARLNFLITDDQGKNFSLSLWYNTRNTFNLKLEWHQMS